MNLDFLLLLVTASAIAGTIVLADLLVAKSRTRAAAMVKEARRHWLVVQARAFLPVLIVVLVIRSFVFEPFRIPSASMMPGLVDGDFIVVSKFSYGLRLPVLNVEILPTWEPQRGDVIVFRLPADPSVNYIKRLIGKPGDHVTVRNNRVTINGSVVPLEAAGVYAEGYGFDGADLAVESLGAAPHRLMFAADRADTDFDGVVPAGHYFFMGDNRNDSRDGRFASVGFVPERNLVGHAVRIWMNLKLFQWPKWQRFGARIV